ncbi:DNA-3-methyladenine glycosylase [Bacillus sp. FJAT-50079]|uniref:DNA-3-methyladenine glycosylase family protein n=1 Tax=Bacillus sp. FJAT-50079 TaxID=2833577 RepID=UPI001BC9FE9B|nr:DNA-3-methyladenine glycosylase [Bacillus sp. FJAT-50079]MBS4209180.1 DNA-3-methyladenine glycosylase 2 family protein [Bacillus sp. FJAT-50079]
MWQEKIEIAGPYQFDLALSRLAIDPLNIVTQEERMIKVPIYSNSPEVATVRAIGTTEKPEFLISGQDSSSKFNVLQKVASIFQWDISLSEIDQHFSTTSLKDVFAKHYGTPIVLEFSLYNTLVKSIIHQQLNMKFAISLTEQFVKTFGFELDGVPFYPSPKTVAELHIEQLRNLKFSQRKAEYIIDLSKLIVSGELNLEHLAQLPEEVVIKELTKIRGIGPWTAQNFLLFGLGRANLFPMADIGIQNAIKALFKLEQKPTITEMQQYSEEWEPYLSYASLYLWRSIEN